MKLNAAEVNEPIWKKIEKHLAERLDVLRLKNDGDLTEVETAKLRGCILAFKEMLDVAKPLTDYQADIGFNNE